MVKDKPRPTDRSRGKGEHREDRDLAGPAQWGRIARRGAGNINYEDPELLAKRRSLKPRREKADPPGERRIPPPPERAVPGADDLRRKAASAVKKGRSKPKRGRAPLSARPNEFSDPSAVLRRLVGEKRGKILDGKLRSAGGEFRAERFRQTCSLLQPLVKEVPELAEGRELMGLAHYRLGRWQPAIDHLEAFRELSGSTEQHPVLADCHRALGRWADVDELWRELGEASPSSELVTEGRIVFAGSLADRGDLAHAISALEQGWKPPKRPRPHHLRRAYALADLYDRAGRTPRARELFGWVAHHDDQLADVIARVKALS